MSEHELPDEPIDYEAGVRFLRSLSIRHEAPPPASDEDISAWADSMLEYHYTGEPVIQPLISRVREEVEDRDRWKARALEAEAERDTLAERASEANEREKALEARAKKAEAALEDIEFFDSCDTREAPE